MNSRLFPTRMHKFIVALRQTAAEKEAVLRELESILNSQFFSDQ